MRRHIFAFGTVLALPLLALLAAVLISPPGRAQGIVPGAGAAASVDTSGLVSKAGDTMTGALRVTGANLEAGTAGNGLANVAGVALVQGAPADGSTAVGVKLNSGTTLANASAKLVSFQNAGAEKAYMKPDGSLVPAADASGTSLGESGKRWHFLYVRSIRGQNASWDRMALITDTNDYRSTWTNSTPGAVGHAFFFSSTITEPTIKIASFNAGSSSSSNVRTSIYSDGRVESVYGFHALPATLATCAAALEGLEQTVAGSGGNLTKRCFCTYDGTTAKWVNLLNPTDRTGTATACPAS